MGIRDELAVFSRYHVLIFVNTFMTYAFFHASRKTLSNSKDSISIFWTPPGFNDSWPEPHNVKNWEKSSMFSSYDQAGIYLGILDTIFMSFYAIGLFASGYIAEKISIRIFLAAGTALNGISLFIFGFVLPMTNCTAFPVWAFIWAINGLAQSCGWPSIVALMGNWFGKTGRGFIMGVWSSNASVGNIIGAFIVNGFLAYGFQYAFLVISFIMLLFSGILFFTIIDHPKEVGIQDLNELSQDDEDILVENDGLNENQSNGVENPAFEAEVNQNDEEVVIYDQNGSENAKPQKSVGFIDALKIPGVVEYSLSYFAMKLVNYSFFFWMPYYLHNRFQWSDTDSNAVSTWFDVGGIIGGIVGGFLSDLWGYRGPVVMGMSALGIPALLGFFNAPNKKSAVSALMTVLGFFTGGASSILSSACSVDLGHEAVKLGMTSAIALVTGIIDGTGSVGAALGQILVPIIEQDLGWSSLFTLFMVMAGLASAALIPVTVREIKRMRRISG